MGGFISLADARLQCHVDGTDEDALISAMVAAAGKHVEQVAGWVCPKRIAEPFVLDAFPGAGLGLLGRAAGVFPGHRSNGWRRGQIKLRMRPIDTASIAISYIDGTGTPQSFTDFRVWEQFGLTRIAPSFGFVWPVAACIPGAVTITADVGFPGSSDDTPDTEAPDDVKHAVRLLTGHFFRNRETVIAGARAAAAEVPLTVDDLLEVDRWGRL